MCGPSFWSEWSALVVLADRVLILRAYTALGDVDVGVGVYCACRTGRFERTGHAQDGLRGGRELFIAAHLGLMMESQPGLLAHACMHHLTLRKGTSEKPAAPSDCRPLPDVAGERTLCARVPISLLAPLPSQPRQATQ
jgi:hypothetical protein